ncbi:hypothetical protein MVES_002812 [Malassezia vespertilionis]|uniref:Uncharacterized protein n=1 Tax=Malassezia vespertilionis TaxID=2020962 RepID=A0A2N1J8U1_9BASI|nr:hypothetical protein MVES_002812 [Malassezia vespertilionis]
MAERPALDTLDTQLSSGSADALPEELDAYGLAQIAVTDARIAFARQVCESVSDLVQHILNAWELADQRNISVLRSIPMLVLAEMLAVLSTHQPFHALGEAIMERLLASGNPWIAKMQGYLSVCAQYQKGLKRDTGTETTVALAALKLLTAMANFARGKLATTVWERFHWASDVHARLLQMRRRGKSVQRASISDPDIRTQYILFLLSFLLQPFNAALKIAILDLGSDGLPMVLRGMVSDAPSVVQTVLLVLHEELFKDQAVPRGAKVKCIDDVSCASIIKLYTREKDAVPNGNCVADVAHHFMLSIATHPGFGICYVDRGWYAPLESAEKGAPALHNKVLAGVLRQLAVLDDLRQQELALRILRACPELVASYFAGTQKTLSLEPRCNSAWLGTMAFVGRVLGLRIPTLDASPPNTPPPMATILGNTAPEVLLRALGRGLKHSNALVQYYACLVMARTVQRAASFRTLAEHTAQTLEEDEHGAWQSTLASLELEWRKRYPPVDALTQLATNTQHSMRQEAALRVLALYHTTLLSMTFDTRYDVGRLLTNAVVEHAAHGLRLDRLCQMHALQILACATEGAFDWTAKAFAPLEGLAQRSYLHFLLALYCTTPYVAIRIRCETLLHTLLAPSALFLQDPRELDAWLHSLPSNQAALASVLNFLDESILRCLKTPHRYAERARVLVADVVPDQDMPVPGPLLMVMVEQCTIRLRRNLFNTNTGVDANASAPILQYLKRVMLLLIAQGKPYAAFHTLANTLCDAGEDTTLNVTAAALKGMKSLLSCVVFAPSPIPNPSLFVHVQQACARHDWDALWALDPVQENLFCVEDAWRAHAAPSLAALAVLHSSVGVYAAVARTAEHGAWRMLWTVLLSRISPVNVAALPEKEVLHQIPSAFAALDAWSERVLLSPTHLQMYLTQHPTTVAWLEKPRTDRAANAFRAAAVAYVCKHASDPAYSVCVAPFVQDAIAGIMVSPNTVLILELAQKLAPLASEQVYATVGTHLLRALENKPTHQSARAQLACLSAYTLASMDHAASTPLLLPLLWRHLSSLVAFLVYGPEAFALLRRVLASILPAGLNGAAPMTRGSLTAMRFAQRQLISLAPLLQCKSHEADVLMFQLLYTLPAAYDVLAAELDAHPAREIVQAWPNTACALLELAVCKHDTKRLNGLVEPVLKAAPRCLDEAERGARCVAIALLYTHTSAQPRTALQLQALLQNKPAVLFHADIAWLVAQVAVKDCTLQYVDMALRWIVRRYAEDAQDAHSVRRAVKATGALIVQSNVQLAASLVEPVLAAAVQHRADDADALLFATIIATHTSMQGAHCVRYMNALLSHSDVLLTARNAASKQEQVLRQNLLALFVRLAEKGIEALDTPATLARTLFLYKGTLERGDRALFALLQRMERERHKPLLNMLRAWSAEQVLVPSVLQYDSLLAAVLSLDPQMVQRTYVELPRSAKQTNAALYDPWFILNLFGGAIMERELQGTDTHLTGLDWLAILRTNVVGVALSACSSHRAPLRQFALVLLGKMYACVQRTSFRERDLVLLVLDRVRNVIPPPPPTSITGTYGEIPWLPSMAMLFAAKCLRYVSMPSQAMFPVLFRFLLQRPLLDATDVPLLYNLLHPTSEQFYQERSFLLRFLQDAFEAHAQVAHVQPASQGIARASSDWRVFKRRHVWDLLQSLYDALAAKPGEEMHRANAGADARDQERLEAIFASAARIPYVAQELVTHRGFLQWIEMRIVAERNTDAARCTFWISLLHAICAAAPTPPTPQVVRRLHTMDARQDFAFVVTVQSIACRALCIDPVVEQLDASGPLPSWLHLLAELVYSLLAYKSLCTTPREFEAIECLQSVALLERATAWLSRMPRQDAASLSTTLLQSTLLLQKCPSLKPRIHALFSKQLALGLHHRAYAPRRWALDALAAPVHTST